MTPEAAGINHWSSHLYVSRLIIHLPLHHYISLSNAHTGCLTKAWHEVGRTPVFTLTSHSIATNDPSAWRLPHQPLIHRYCPLITVEGFIMRLQVNAAPHSYKSSPFPTQWSWPSQLYPAIKIIQQSYKLLNWYSVHCSPIAVGVYSANNTHFRSNK